MTAERDTPQDLTPQEADRLARRISGAPLPPLVDYGPGHHAKGEGVQDLAKRPGVQDLDPALAERLAQLRKALGLSVADMAQKLGLWGANGADNLRQMERCARPLPGTLQVLLGYMERDQVMSWADKARTITAEDVTRVRQSLQMQPQPYQLEMLRRLGLDQPDDDSEPRKT